MFIVCKDKNTTYKIGDAFVIDGFRKYANVLTTRMMMNMMMTTLKMIMMIMIKMIMTVLEVVVVLKAIFERSQIICFAICTDGSPCPAGLVDGTTCFCNRSRCKKCK